MREVKLPQGQIITFTGANGMDNIKRTINGFVTLAIEKGMNLRELKAYLQGLVDQVAAKIEDSGSASR